MRHRWPATVALILLLGGGWLGMSTAATPGFPDAPPPRLCAVAAPGFEALNATIAGDASVDPASAYTGGTLPAGTPADDQAADAFRATVRELVACYNAGELLRSYGLYTDGYLRRLFARQGPFTQEAYDSLARPEPAPRAERAQLLEITGVRLLPGGLIGGNVTIEYARVPMPKRFFIVITPEDNSWEIAEIIGEISFSVP